MTRAPGLVVPGVALRGVACALPERCVENGEFVERLGEKPVADVTALTGVATRYWAAPSQTASDLCFTAADRVLANLDWQRDSIDALIFVSQTPDQRMPATACILHGKLGLAQRCQAFDVNLGCSGYVCGLWLAAGLISAGCRRVLMLSGDTSSRLIDPGDRSTALLFGDAGSASALERDDAARDVHFVLGSDGAGAPHITIAGGGYRPEPDGVSAGDCLQMDGAAVFGFTLTVVPAMIREVLENAGRTVSDIDFFALHQANRFILRHIAKKLAIPADRLPINIERFGNTSSASIPLVLCTDLAPRLTADPADIVLGGFGVGLSWGAALFSGLQLQCAELVTA